MGRMVEPIKYGAKASNIKIWNPVIMSKPFKMDTVSKIERHHVG